jgi:glycosyltransferase involved in cell wall biosynthesis
MEANAGHLLRQLRERPCILMVATIEPRKGQQQVLDALDLLWDEGNDLNLVLVGKSGWGMEQFENRLQRHPQRDKQLFWLRGISDEMLQQVYAASSLLLSASTGEGFGLPLIEAAQHGLPILARDIPVFREIAGDHALYFSGDKPRDLAMAIRQWQRLHGACEVPSSAGLNYLSWKQSASQLKALLLGQREWYATLLPVDAAAIG